MRQYVVIGTALLVAACGGSGPSSPSAAAPSLSATATPGGLQTDAPATASPSVAATAAAQTPGQGGVVGPVFGGTLVQAFPRVVAGQAVKVEGPFPAKGMENLGEAALAVIEQLALDPADVEFAIGTDSAMSVMITGLRFPGANSADLDARYLAAQEAETGTSNFRVVSIAGRNVHAYDHIGGTSYWWVNGDLLLYVFGSPEDAMQAIAAMPVPTVALVPGGEQLAKAEVELAIATGAHAGRYSGATSSGGCTRDALGDNQFGLQYTNEAAADGFTSFQMIVRDAAAAADAETDDFMAAVTFGPLLTGTTYQLDSAQDDGRGRVSISQGDKDHAVVTVSGETADGVQLDATITCNVVFDMGA